MLPVSIQIIGLILHTRLLHKIDHSTLQINDLTSRIQYARARSKQQLHIVIHLLTFCLMVPYRYVKQMDNEFIMTGDYITNIVHIWDNRVYRWSANQVHWGSFWLVDNRFSAWWSLLFLLFLLLQKNFNLFWSPLSLKKKILNFLPYYLKSHINFKQIKSDYARLTLPEGSSHFWDCL